MPSFFSNVDSLANNDFLKWSGLLGDPIATGLGLPGSFTANAQGPNMIRKAAQYADQNATLSARMTAIQEMQENRKTYQALGTEQADTAGAGFSLSGSGIDLLKSSAQQASLSKNLIATQGEINVNSYRQEAEGLRAQADAQSTSNAAGTLGIVGKIFGF